jgi:high-affinity Fe2+/Pb2+ permease
MKISGRWLERVEGFAMVILLAGWFGGGAVARAEEQPEALIRQGGGDAQAGG